MFFAAERSIHEGSLEAYALPQLPPEVRVKQRMGIGGRRGVSRGSSGCWQHEG